MAKVDTNSPKVRRMLFYVSPLVSGYILAIFHAASRASSLLPFRLFLRPILKFWSIGVALIRITWWNYSKRWFSVSNVGVTWHGFGELNTSDWLQYVWASPQNRWRLRRLHIMKYATQLSCILQYCHSTFGTILFRLLARLFINLVVCIRALFPKFASIFQTCGTSTPEDAISHRMELCKFLWGNPCTAVEPFSHLDFCLLGLLVLDAFFTFCCVEDLGGGFGCVDFARLSLSCRQLHLSPFEHYPLAFHCQQSPRLLCSHCFALWFLTTALVSKFPFLASKSFILKILLDTSFYHRLQSVIIRFGFLLMNLHIVQFQYGLEFLRLSYSYFCTNFPRCHQVGFVSSTIEFRSILNRMPEYCHFEERL